MHANLTKPEYTAQNTSDRSVSCHIFPVLQPPCIAGLCVSVIDNIKPTCEFLIQYQRLHACIHIGDETGEVPNNLDFGESPLNIFLFSMLY